MMLFKDHHSCMPNVKGCQSTGETYILGGDVAAASFVFNPSSQIYVVDDAYDILDLKCQRLIQVCPHTIQLGNQPLDRIF